MILSGLEQAESQSVELEQYPTNGDLASRWLTDMSSFGDLFEGCSVLDLGTGNVILGLGALAMGAARATLVDSDSYACNTAMRNAESMGISDSVEVIHATIGEEELRPESVDLVISNPPWGRQTPKADRPFLDEILSIGRTAHLMHSAEASHIQSLFIKQEWNAERYAEADFALPAAYSHHISRRGKTRAAFWRLTPGEKNETMPDRS